MSVHSLYRAARQLVGYAWHRPTCSAYQVGGDVCQCGYKEAFVNFIREMDRVKHRYDIEEDLIKTEPKEDEK